MALSTIQNNSFADTAVHGFRNLVTNGAMTVAQRSSSVSGITSSSYPTIDRWKFEIGNMGTWTASQEASGPSGFSNSAKILCTTADASPAATDEVKYSQFIEAQNLQQLAYGTSDAKQMTLSFWVKSNKTGTFIVWFYQDDDGRQLTTSYTIDVADTWEYKTILVASDTTGVIDNNSGAGLRVSFVLGAGSSYTSGTAATTWEALVDANRYVGQTVNLADATSNYWQITGVQLEVAAEGESTPFEHRSYGDELQRCLRYFEKLGGSGATANYAAFGIGYVSVGTGDYGAAYVSVQPKRATPTVSTTGTVQYVSPSTNGSFTLLGDAYIDASGTGYINLYPLSPTGTFAQPLLIRANNDATAGLLFDAEL